MILSGLSPEAKESALRRMGQELTHVVGGIIASHRTKPAQEIWRRAEDNQLNVWVLQQHLRNK